MKAPGVCLEGLAPILFSQHTFCGILLPVCAGGSGDGANGCIPSVRDADHRLHQLGLITKTFPMTTVRSVLATTAKTSVRERNPPTHVGAAALI